MKDDIELVTDYCPKDCIYRMQVSGSVDFCAYLLIKYEPRGCPVSKCDKYKSGKRKVGVSRTRYVK